MSNIAEEAAAVWLHCDLGFSTNDMSDHEGSASWEIKAAVT
ncbi:hypothetical protein [Paraburkholderia jirisanensis]